MKDKDKLIVFAGPFRELCCKFISYKRSLGYTFGKSFIYSIRSMDNFFKKYNFNRPRLTKEMALAFTAYREGQSLKTQHMRMSLIRQFAIFMNNLGYDAYVYPTKLIKLGKTFTPYIFTHDEISKIIKVSDNLKVCNNSPNYHLVYPVLIRLLYGCGLRISEALSLKVSDVNLHDGILTITKSKFNKSRLVPVSVSLSRVLSDYAANMNFSYKDDGYFFPAPDKGRYNRTPVYLKFRHIVKEAGIFHPKNPRLHDLRHTFAVHALEKMVGQGRDIYCSLPVLCAYLGHTGIESSQKYLRLTEQSFSSITIPLETLYKSIFPEVKSNEK